MWRDGNASARKHGHLLGVLLDWHQNSKMQVFAQFLYPESDIGAPLLEASHTFQFIRKMLLSRTFKPNHRTL